MKQNDNQNVSREQETDWWWNESLDIEFHADNQVEIDLMKALIAFSDPAEEFLENDSPLRLKELRKRIMENL